MTAEESATRTAKKEEIVNLAIEAICMGKAITASVETEVGRQVVQNKLDEVRTIAGVEMNFDEDSNILTIQPTIA